MKEYRISPYSNAYKRVVAWKQFQSEMPMAMHYITGYVTSDGMLIINEYNSIYKQIQDESGSCAFRKSENTDLWYGFVSIDEFLKWTSWDKFFKSSLSDELLGFKAINVLQQIRNQSDESKWK